MTVITENQTTDVQDYYWAAETIAGFTNDYPMYIRLVNAEAQDCTGCHARSVNFSVLENDAANSKLAAPAGKASANGEPMQTSSKTLKLGLGIGLGVGLPFIAALSVSATWLCLRRRRYGDRPTETVSAYRLPDSPLLDSREHNHTPASGDTSSTQQRASQFEIDGPPMFELQPTLERVEAPRDAQRVELEGSGLMRMVGGKWT